MTNALIGTASIGVIQGIGEMPSPTPTGELIKVLIQVILGIATLFKMFPRKQKEVISNQNTNF